MKKIMFEDSLTQAVLDYYKTNTRRLCKEQYWSYSDIVNAQNGIFHFERPRYKVGEVVAIAQSYKNIAEHSAKTAYDVAKWMYDNNITKYMAGWLNKMFVRADLMPHHIQITDIKVERLQDISDEDCLKEGVVRNVHRIPTDAEQYITKYYPCQHSKDCAKQVGWGRVYDTPREAFAVLINKISGKGTWESNPFVWVYEFKLID